MSLVFVFCGIIQLLTASCLFLSDAYVADGENDLNESHFRVIGKQMKKKKTILD